MSDYSFVVDGMSGWQTKRGRRMKKVFWIIVALVVLNALNAFAENKERKAPEILPETGMSWSEVLNRILKTWEPGYEYSVKPYSFRMDDNWESTDAEWSVFYVIVEISKSPKLCRIAYSWASPIITERFRALSKDDKNKVLAYLKDINKYARNFDFDREAERIRQNPLAMCESEPQEWFEAFWFRRFRDGLNHKMVSKYSTRLLRKLQKL